MSIGDGIQQTTPPSSKPSQPDTLSRAPHGLPPIQPPPGLTALIIPFFWTRNLTSTLIALIDLFIVISYCYIMTLCLLILFGMYLNFGTSKRRLIWCLFWSAKWRPVFLTVPSLGSVFSSKEFININKRSMPDSPFLPLMPFLGKSFLESSTSTPLALPSPKRLLITKAKSWDASQSSASKYVGINDL